MPRKRTVDGYINNQESNGPIITNNTLTKGTVKGFRLGHMYYSHSCRLCADQNAYGMLLLMDLKNLNFLGYFFFFNNQKGNVANKYTYVIASR